MGRRDDEEERGAKILDLGLARKLILGKSLEDEEDCVELYLHGMPPGDSTGWAAVDPFYTVMPGQLTIVTGWPSSGKSEWLDMLLVNLIKAGAWKFIIHSPESRPRAWHLSRFVEKFSGKPFAEGPTERITEFELRAWLRDMNVMFTFLRNKADDSMSLEEVMRGATMQLPEWGGSKVGLVIDPWNELDHFVPSGMTETQYICAKLREIKNWAVQNQVHVWIVGHPRVTRRDDQGKLPVPRPDMISDSQHWWNKADNCVTVHRDQTQESERVEIHVQKVRARHVGRIGVATLLYDRTTGQYRDDVHTPFNVGRKSK